MKQVMDNPFQLIGPLLWLLATLLGGWLLRRFLFRIIRRWAAASDSRLDQLVIDSLRGPIILWALILGVHLATQNSEIPRRYLVYVPTTLTVLWVWSLTLATSGFVGNIVRFYGASVTGAKAVTSITQKLAQIAVLAVGITWLLKVVFDLSLTPILTTLGVGGLAVALALQDTLSNLFAGFYVSVSGLVRIGDYIRLNTNEEGYVSDINWRCTTIRTLGNNVIVIPNNKLGQAIYTNFSLPEPNMGLSVPVSVALTADIDQVEAVLLDETGKAAKEIPGILADSAPTVRFHPGQTDTALVFQININVSEFRDQFRVQSELRKRVLKRLRQEGIPLPTGSSTVIVRDAV